MTAFAAPLKRKHTDSHHLDIMAAARGFLSFSVIKFQEKAECTECRVAFHLCTRCGPKYRQIYYIGSAHPPRVSGGCAPPPPPSTKTCTKNQSKTAARASGGAGALFGSSGKSIYYSRQSTRVPSCSFFSMCSVNVL